MKDVRALVSISVSVFDTIDIGIGYFFGQCINIGDTDTDMSFLMYCRFFGILKNVKKD